MLVNLKKKMMANSLSQPSGNLEVFNKHKVALREGFLELLSFLHYVCESEKIPYWLEGGTLLGAVRHNGFIP